MTALFAVPLDTVTIICASPAALAARAATYIRELLPGIYNTIHQLETESKISPLDERAQHRLEASTARAALWEAQLKQHTINVGLA
jgi:hypothetical protein